MELKQLSRYYPQEQPYGESVQYFISEDKQDFYESLESFTLKYKLCIEPDTGVIRAIAEDVSTLYPVGFSVVETDSLPDGCDISGGWQFINGEITPVPPNLVNLANVELKTRFSKATEAIETLQDAVDFDMATEPEKAALSAWRKYRVLLSRIDTSDPLNLEWPESPE